jgi:heme exporter protein C
MIGTKLWFAGSLLGKARADNISRDAGKAWVAERFGSPATAPLEELPR